MRNSLYLLKQLISPRLSWPLMRYSVCFFIPRPLLSVEIISIFMMPSLHLISCISWTIDLVKSFEGMLSSIFDSVFEISAPGLAPPLKSTSYFLNSPEFDLFFSVPAVIADFISPSTAVIFRALSGVALSAGSNSDGLAACGPSDYGSWKAKSSPPPPPLFGYC